jgi:hypothetical protein
VPATGGRRGRRDNGLAASTYASAGDVDPRIGEHLLDVLAAGGIAAYLQPSTDQHPITRSTSLPARPTDRLFVDREHLDTACEYLRQVTAGTERRRASDAPVADAAVGTTDDATAPPDPIDDRTDTEPAAKRDDGAAKRDETGAPRDESTATTIRESGTAEPDVETAWLEIVAGYHRTVDTDPPWPKSEDVALGEPRPLPHIEPRPLRRAEPGEPSLLDALDTFGAALPDDDDEGYVPPPPPPLPRISAAAALGVGGIALGLLLFVWPSLLPLDVDTVLLIAFGSIVAGFGTLIWRLRPGDDEDDDLDDGARI